MKKRKVRARRADPVAATHRSRTPGDQLFQVIMALERGAVPIEEDRAWLVDGLKRFFRGEVEHLEVALGLSGKGRGTAASRLRHTFRDGQYRLRMALYIAAGYTVVKAADRVAEEMADVLRRPDGEPLVRGALELLEAPPLSAETLARLHRAWSKEAVPGLVLLAHAEEIARLRSERESGEKRKKRGT